MKQSKSKAPRIRLPDGQRVASEQALQSAIALHQQGRLRQAAQIYRALLAHQPQHPDALHLLGLTERQAGRYDAAIELIQRAIAAQPDSGIFHNNLAELYRSLENGPQAERAARRAIELAPELPEAYLNLGASLHLQRRLDAAIAAYEQALQRRPGWLEARLGIADALLVAADYTAALALYQQIAHEQPDYLPVLTRIGMALRRAQRAAQAIAHYQACIARHPQVPELHNNLAQLYLQSGERAAAITCLERVLELTPADSTARHLLDAVTGQHTERAPADYVRSLFDNYAETFDSHLVDKLHYRTPQRLAAALRPLLPQAARLTTLDLGCGTGLMIEALRDVCAQSVGVDIAPKMIERARHKGLYSELYAEDLIGFMQRSAANRYELILAADVFVYLGDLAPIFAETRRLLRPGGWFAFTVEANDGSADFELDHTGRYRHRESYLQTLAANNRLQSLYQARSVIRTQHEQPVQGYICVLTRPNA